MSLHLTGAGAESRQDRGYTLLKDTAVIYVEYESGYAEFAVSETETEETEIGEIEAETSEITIESKHISAQEETEEFDPARMLSEDSKDVCGLYLKAGDPAYQLEVKPGGRLNRNQLTFTVNNIYRME